MIDDPPLLQIVKARHRPAAQLVDGLRQTPTSFIADALGGRGALDWRIKSMGQVSSMIGVALTCHCGPADNLALCAAVARCEPGDVIVAATDGFKGTSVVGDLLLGIARNRGAAGFITDGLIRDQRDIETLKFPCFAMGVTPNSPARSGPGTVGLPVSCGGQQISTGDIVVGDSDGIVIVPSARLSEVLDRLISVREAEAMMLAQVKAGLREVGFIERLPAERIHVIDDTGES